MPKHEVATCLKLGCAAYDKLTERNIELEAENKKMKGLKCPPISSGDTCICPIEELETLLIKKDERIEELEAKD